MSFEDTLDENGVVTEGPLKGSHTREGGVLMSEGEAPRYKRVVITIEDAETGEKEQQIVLHRVAATEVPMIEILPMYARDDDRELAPPDWSVLWSREPVVVGLWLRVNGRLLSANAHGSLFTVTRLDT